MNEIETYIRQSAAQHGIDPDVAVRVAMSEGGLNDPVRQSDYRKGSTREPSYGPFQLLIGGPGTGFGGGLGNRALAAGIDPRNPEHWQKAIDFALAEAGKRGWGQWYGAARTGIGNYQGIGEHQTASGQASPTPETTAAGGHIRHPPNPNVGSMEDAKTLIASGQMAPVPVAKDDEPPAWGKRIADAFGGMSSPWGGGGGAMGGGGIQRLPAYAPPPAEPAPIVAPNMADESRRNMLAALMQKYWVG
jgi:hypothetical protein